MTLKEEIKFNFAQDYYRNVLIKIIQRTDYFMTVENYDLVCKELSNVYSHVSNAIERHTTEEESQKIGQMIKELDEQLIKQKVLRLGRKSRMNMKRQIILNAEIRKSSKELYTKIMGTIDKMNMLFPRETKDTRLPIYQTS